MAKIELLLQAFGAGIHVTALKELLSLPGLKRFVASVAFVREEGVEAIAAELKAKHKACAFFVGIRNDITSVQSVRRLLELGVKVFAVDTASRSTLFHPKMFLSVGPGKGIAVIGSANVTFSGLHNNVEASTVIHLDSTDKDDAKFLKASLDSIDELPTRFPDHVFQIKTEAAANELFNQGRLTDEEMILATPPRSSVRKGERDNLKPIKLPRQSSPKHGKRIRASLKAQATAAAVTKPTVPTPIGASQGSDFILIWESKALTERDLNIPTGVGTNATGSMLWKKGAAEDIDQRHFFRDEVFVNIPWKQDPKYTHYQRAEADFTLAIKGLNYGTHRLKLSHNTNKTSKTYKQNNAMTSVSWGPVAEIIGKRDLLGRTMSLYRNGKTPPQFLIEID
jgi:HKD family nuclease